tara:strand:+ start:21 stop:857 length:837 start_codon:yes stop_codon:yes gene_type:complete
MTHPNNLGMTSKLVTIYKTIFLNIILFSFATFPAWARGDKPVKVILLGGQSNMVGSAKTENLKPPYNKPFSKIKAWNPKKKKWTPLSPEVFNSKGNFGPEIHFAHSIANDFPMHDFRLVKYAASGTALYDDWSPSSKGEQYLNFMKITKDALMNLDDSGVEYELSAMLWLQGESDAHENKAETYEKNLSDFISHLRTEFSVLSMPFIIARVRNYYGGETGQAKIVRDAQVRIADSTNNVAWFDTDDCSMQDEGHYDADGLETIGRRFAKKYRETINKQ